MSILKVIGHFKKSMKKEFKNQLATAILSSPIVYIPHFDYQLIDDTIRELIASESAHKIFDLSFSENLIEFDCGQNRVIRFEDKRLDLDMSDYGDIKDLLRDIVNQKGFHNPVILLLKNFTSYFQDVEIQCLLASFVVYYETHRINSLSTIIIASPLPVTSIPPEVERYIKVIDISAPSEKEILEILSDIQISSKFQTEDEKNDIKMDLCRTLQGLQLFELEQILHSSLIRTGGRITEKTKALALEEKKNIVKKSGIIEVVDADVRLDQVGGLDYLKEEIKRKGVIYRNLNLSQTYNINLPKGILIIGMPGCGKSMIAKSIAYEFGVSLLRLDINRLMGQYVGQSEANLRKALATAEAAHPCVLWIDEIEKAFAGSNGQNNNMLVMRLMGHFLTWMQERKTPVYIVATANDVMRPEFMRKGRFDEVYFVDFPTEEERQQILEKKINKYRDNPNCLFEFKDIDYSSLAKKMLGNEQFKDEICEEKKGFSGAEIESIVNIVVEDKFVNYLNKRNSNMAFEDAKEIIEEKDFDDAIKLMSTSVMANQVSKMDNETKTREKTNIERIYDLQRKYKFKRATK